MRDIFNPSRMVADSRLRALATMIVFGVLTVVHTWPLAAGLASQVQNDPDVTTGMWALTELARQMLHNPLHLMDGNIFYPFPDTIAVLDHQFADSLLAAPLLLAGAGIALTYNAVILLTFFLNAVCTWLLVRRLTGSDSAGVIAGCAFAFSSYHAYHLAQSHLLVTQWLPLALLTLHRYLERPEWRRWGAFAGATLLVALSSWHVAVIGSLAIAIVALWTLTAKPVDVRRRLVGLALAAGLCGLALVPLARAYRQMGTYWPPRTGEGRETLGTLAGNSASLDDLVSPPFNSRAPYAAVLSPPPDGAGVFPGLVVVLLALIGVLPLAVRRRGPAASPRVKLMRASLWVSSALVGLTVAAAFAGEAGAALLALLRPTAPFVLFGVSLAATGLAFVRRAGKAEPREALPATYAALAGAGILLAMGPRVTIGSVDAGSGLWRLDLLPVRLLIRAPDRLSLLLMLAAAVLAGFGAARLLKGLTPARRWALVAALLVAVNVDLAFRMTPLRSVPTPGRVDAWLMDEAEEGAVVEYPLALRLHPWPMYYAQLYDRRTVNGAGYLFPWEYRELEDLPDLDPQQLALLWEHFHPRFVVLRAERYPPAERRKVFAAIEAQPDALQPRVHFGDDYVFELVDRGRDTELYRRWPRPLLARRRSMLLEASVTPGREDTVGELVVALNGQILLQARGSEAEHDNAHEIIFDTRQLVNGSNTFLIWADYRFTETSIPHPIGTTGVSLPADVSLRADRERARVQVNGRVFRPDKGYFLAVLDPYTGEVVSSGEFNVSWFAEDSEALAAFVRGIRPGFPVVLVTEFDASRELSAAAVEALRELGMETDLRGRFQMLHAAVGVKGAAPGSALEATDPVRATLELGVPELRQVQISSLELRR